MKIYSISFRLYQQEFKAIAKKIDKDLLFKVDLLTKDNKLTTYYNIPAEAVCAVTLINFNTIELKSLISSGGGAGSALVQFIIAKYSCRYKIILNSFESNNKFYLKNKFRPYKISAYNPVFDPDGLNKNKESVIFYEYSGGGLNE